MVFWLYVVYAVVLLVAFYLIKRYMKKFMLCFISFAKRTVDSIYLIIDRGVTTINHFDISDAVGTGVFTTSEYSYEVKSIVDFEVSRDNVKRGTQFSFGVWQVDTVKPSLRREADRKYSRMKIYFDIDKELIKTFEEMLIRLKLEYEK